MGDKKQQTKIDKYITCQRMVSVMKKKITLSINTKYTQCYAELRVQRESDLIILYSLVMKDLPDGLIFEQ